ncbi:hypothetical protein EES44_07740 [Streptomyces sp. ADI96-15]|uniref:hypothetical protein n=1 Tax=Streptomyces sp. ADI96-15 TaxID=1522761 RepID=UPI000F558390|nr:hypothetical protein [Streptomyces sp. ADI96-15]RPK69174.1 hypothetical protein EES44_07740 [Streptomyces sp. ADI96-15]
MRHTFGATIADYVVQPTDGTWSVAAGAVLTFWSDADAGDPYTDLLDSSGNSVAEITADEQGFIPSFSGPDGVTGMWADAGGGTRAWMQARGVGVGEGGGGGYTSISRIVASATAPADVRAAARWVCDGIADQEEIQAALDDARDNGGGEVQLTVGDYNLTAPLSIEGTDDVDVEIGINLSGQGARATMLRAAPGIEAALHLTKVVRVHLRDLGITVGGTTDGITSSTTSGEASGHRSFWNSSFKNLQINGPWNSSHTGWAINMGSPFRSVFENIEVGGTRNGLRFYSEHADFNPGDCTVERVFVDLVGDGGTAYQVESTTPAGVMNQIEFEMCEAIASGTGCTGIHIAGAGGWGTAHTHWRGVNLEDFDRLVHVEYGTSNTFRLNHVNLRGAPGLTAFTFGANSFGNSILSTGLLYATDDCQLYTDANTMDSSIPNRIMDTRVYTSTGVTVTGTPNSAGTTVRRGITAAGAGTVSIADSATGDAFAPVDHGLLAWTQDPATAGSGFALNAGGVYLSKVKLTSRARVSNILYGVTTAGTGLVAGQNAVGLYSASGALLATAEDQTTQLGSVGVKTAPLTAPVTLGAGSYYVAFLANGTGNPSVLGGGGVSSALNAGLSTGAARFLGPIGTGQTALPSTVAVGGGPTNIASRWAALS